MQSAVESAFDAGRQSDWRKALIGALKARDEQAVLSLASGAIEATAAVMRPAMEKLLTKVRNTSAKMAAEELKQQLIRGLWYDKEKGYDDHGREGEKDAARSARAKASHNGVTKEKIRLSARSEQHVAQMVGGRVNELEQHNHPADVTVHHEGKLHGIEVKTILPGAKRDKITVHPSSRQRKEKWAKANKATMHMVAIDTRGGKKDYYYRKGVGSYRLGGMTRVKNAAHLKELLAS